MKFNKSAYLVMKAMHSKAIICPSYLQSKEHKSEKKRFKLILQQKVALLRLYLKARDWLKSERAAGY